MDGKSFNNDMLNTIASTAGPAATAALLQLLRDSREDLQCEVLRILVNRNDLAINAQIARMLPALDKMAFKLLGEDIAILEPIARSAISDSDENIRHSFVKLMIRCGRPSLSYLLAESLNDEAVAVRKRAIEGICNLIREYRSRPAELLKHVTGSIAGPLRSISTSRNTDLLQIIILLGRYCPAQALENLDKPAGRMSGVLSQMLHSMPAAEAGEFVLYAQKYRHLARICRSYISQASWGDLARLGRYCYWQLVSSVRQSLREIKNIRSVTENPTALADLPAAEQPHAMRMVLACGLSTNLRRTILAAALGADRPVATAAMEPAMFGRDSCADLTLLGLHGRHRDIQSVATGRVISQGVDPHFTQHLLKNLDAMTEPSRLIMGQFLAGLSFERYWRSYGDLDESVRCSAGRALLKLDDCVAEMLRGRLTSSDVSGQFRAVEIVRRMGAADVFASQLARLASMGDHTVRSAAVAALAGAKQYDALGTLSRRLDDDDTRVQANAIEALETLGGSADIVLDKLDSPDARVRANAVKWFVSIDNPQGPITLAAMLTDERPEHRISAMWVVKELKYTHARPLVTQLANGDPDVRIRARAAGLQKQMAVWAAQPQETAI